MGRAGGVWVLAMLLVAGCGSDRAAGPTPGPDPSSPVSPTPRPASLAAVTFDRSSVTGGQPVTATVRLSGAAAAGGVEVALSSSHDAVTVPPSIAIAAGQASIDVTITTKSTPTDATVTLTATAAGVVQKGTIDVYASGVLESLIETSGHKYLWAGPGWEVRGTMRGVAPALTIIELRSANPAALQPSGMMQFAAGDTQQRVQLIAKAVPDDTPATITASSGGQTRQLEMVVTAPPSIRIISEADDYVGQGRTQTQSDSNAMRSATGRAGCGGRFISFTVPSPVGFGEWFVHLAAPRGSVIRPGTYDAVSNSSDESRAQYQVSLNGRSCMAGTARVVVDLVDYETALPSAPLHRFRGIIESRCENGAGLRAEVSVNDPGPRLFADRCS